MSIMQCERWRVCGAGLALVVLLAVGARAEAAEPEEAAAVNNVFTLGEIEVGGRMEDGCSVAVERIYDEEMREFNADRLNEAVNLLPGVTQSKTGARNEGMLYLRGLDLKHAPLFLDGIPVYVPYDGYPDLARFTTFNLSELVVAKGAASVLYGPNTMGGAINLVTRKPEKEFEGGAGAGYGSGKTYRAYANAGSRLGAWYVQGGASLLSSETFPLSASFTPTQAEDGGDRNNAYQRDDTLNLRAGYAPSADDEYVMSFSKVHGVKGVPPYAGGDSRQTLRYWQWPYWNVINYRFTSRTGLGYASYLKLRAFYDIFENSLFSYDDSTYSTISRRYAFKSWYDDHTDGASIELGTGWMPGHAIKAAAHFKQDVHNETNEGEPTKSFQDDVISFGVEDTIALGERLSAVAGVGWDAVYTRQAQDLDSRKQLTDFPLGSTAAWNPQLSLFYTTEAMGAFHIAVAGKSRLPSIKDKYSYRLGSAIPNPDLLAERSVNYEAGYAGTLAEAVHLKAAAFYNDVFDYIILKTIPDPDNPAKTTTQNQNVGRVRLYGAEFEAVAGFGERLETGANYTLLYWENQSGSEQLTDLPRHKAMLFIRCTPLDRLKMLADAEYNSSRYSSSDAVRVAGEFVVVNFKVSYEFIRGLAAEAGVANVFDRDYALQEGYPEPGRNYFVNAQYRF